MIGVMGWVECEKIMLVQEIARRAIEDKFFDKVIIAEITLTQDQKHNFLKKITCDLGLESDQNVFGRAGQSEETLCLFW